MINRLKIKDSLDVLDFVKNNKDNFEDFYITVNRQRLFFNKDLKLIEKILKNQKCFGYYEKDLKGILFIIKEKGFRTYIKLLSLDNKINMCLLQYLNWNYSEQDMYFKLKKENPICECIKKLGFSIIGNRGKELLFEKKGIKSNQVFIAKDDFNERK